MTYHSSIRGHQLCASGHPGVVDLTVLVAR